MDGKAVFLSVCTVWDDESQIFYLTGQPGFVDVNGCVLFVCFCPV